MTQVTHHLRLLATGPLPVWVGLLAVGVALGAAGWLLQRELRHRRGPARARWLPVTRGSVVGLLALLVFQPVLFIRRDETRPARLLLVVDRSRSMLRDDAYTGGTLLNLAAARGDVPLPPREDLPDRVRHEVANWCQHLTGWHTKVVAAGDALSQGIPPPAAYAQLTKEARARLPAALPGLRAACDDLARLQARLSPPAETAPKLEPQWFQAAPGFLDRLTDLVARLADADTAELSEEKTRAHRHGIEEALQAGGAAAEALTALQDFCDTQFEAALTEPQRDTLRQLAAANRFTWATRVLSAVTNDSKLAAAHTIQLVDPAPLTAANATAHTDLYGAVQEALTAAGQTTVAGLVLVSDGQQNLPARPEVLRELASRRIHFLTVGVGRPETLPDVALLNYDLPATLLAGSRATVRAALKTVLPAATEVTLSLAHNGTTLAETKWAADAEQTTVALEFPVPATTDTPLVLTVNTTPPDAVPNNDQVALGVSVLPEAARVLVIAPAAHWDLVYLLRALAKTPWRVEIGFGDRGSDDAPDQAAAASALAEKLAQLNRYRLVVLAGAPVAGLTAETVTALQEFVTTAGGNLLLVAGPAGPWYGETLAGWIGTPAEAPPSETAARWEITAAAANHPVVVLAADSAESLGFWQRLALPLQVRPVPPQDLPLLSVRNQLCLSLGFYGRGRVYALGCGDLFRLREWDGAPVADRLLRNILDDAVRPTFPNTDSTVAVYPPLPLVGSTAHVIRPSERKTIPVRIDQAGALTVDVPGQGPLVVRARAPLSLEDVNIGLATEPLRAIATAGGGNYVPLSELRGQWAGIPPQQDVTTTMRVIRLWNLWFLLPLLAALMTVDWVLRRKQGLVL